MPLASHAQLRARAALERYWHYLLGPVAFAPVSLIATEFSGLSFDLLSFLLTILFFASLAPVLWLLVSKRVRYSFWLATGAVYLTAGVVASLATFVIRLLAT